MFDFKISDKVSLKMGKFEAVFLMFTVLVMFSVVGVFAETPLDQLHPLYEIDFSTGEANDNLDMDNHDILDVDSLIANYVESIDVESESITSDVVTVSEEMKFPEPSQVRFPPGTVMPMADECPPGWEEFDEGQGRVLAGLKEGDDQFGSLLGIGGEDEVDLGVENLPEMTLTGRTEESDMDVSYRKADLSSTSRARNPYASIPPAPRLGPDAYTPDSDTTDIGHSHIHPIEIDMGEGEGLKNKMPYFNVEFCVLNYEPPQEMYDGGYEFDSMPDTEEMDSPVDKPDYEVLEEMCEDDVDDAEDFGDSNELCSTGSETSLRCPYPEDHSFYHETDNDCVAEYLLELGWEGEEVDVQENELTIDYTVEPDHIDLGINIEPFIGTRTYYEEGKEVEIEAQDPEEIENYDVEFLGWTGDKSSNSLDITVEMTEDIEVVAEYEITNYDSDGTEIHLTSELGGQVVDPGEGFFWYGSGSSLDVEVVRHTMDDLDFEDCGEKCDESYIFVGWDDHGDNKVQYFEDDEMYMENTFEVPDNDVELTALFEKGYHLETDSTSGGYVDVGKDSIEGIYRIESGESVDIEGVADDMYSFVEWTGDTGVLTGNTDERINEVVLDSSTGDAKLEAVFERSEFELTVDVDGGGSTDPSEGVHTFDDGENVIITADADDGWEFSHWDGDCSGGDVECELTMDSDMDVTAVFEEEPEVYDVNLVVHEDSDSGAEGEGELFEGDASIMQFDELPLSDSFEEGTEVTANVRDTDYDFVEWGSGPCEGSTDNTCEFTLTDDEELGAVYEGEIDPICHDGDGVILDGDYFPCDSFPGIAGTVNRDEDCDYWGSATWTHLNSGIRMNVEAEENCVLYYQRRRSSIGHPEETGVHYIDTEDWDTLNVKLEIEVMTGTSNRVQFYYGGSDWDDRDGGWTISDLGEHDFSIDVSGRDEVQIRWNGRTNNWLRFTVTEIYLE